MDSNTKQNVVDFHKKVQDMVKSIDLSGHTPLQSFLKSLKPFLGLSIDYDLIKASLNFWDVKTHVFRIKGQELCPLVEEIEGFLDLAKGDTILVPSTNNVYDIGLERLLGVPKSEDVNFLHKNTIVLEKILSYFSPPHKNVVLMGGLSYPQTRLRACVLLVLGYYLFKSGVSSCPVRVISMTKNLEYGRRIGPVVLGELIMSLDNACRNPNDFLCGALLVLHMWLYEKFSLLKAPSLNYLPHQVKGRGIHDDYKRIVAKGAWHEAFDREICWFQSFLRFGEIVYSTYRHDGVLLPAVHTITYYFPWRCLRQIGNRQVIIVDIPRTKCETKDSYASGLDTVSEVWANMKVLNAQRALGNLGMDVEYRMWLKEWYQGKGLYDHSRSLGGFDEVDLQRVQKARSMAMRTCGFCSGHSEVHPGMCNPAYMAVRGSQMVMGPTSPEFAGTGPVGPGSLSRGQGVPNFGIPTPDLDLEGRFGWHMAPTGRGRPMGRGFGGSGRDGGPSGYPGRGFGFGANPSGSGDVNGASSSGY